MISPDRSQPLRQARNPDGYDCLDDRDGAGVMIHPEL
jgi:hypothetical protein